MGAAAVARRNGSGGVGVSFPAWYQHLEQGRASPLLVHLLELTGEPLRDYETIVNLIARTTTAKGLQVICRLDRRKYATGRRISDEEMKTINLEPNRFHGEWNYVIRPHRTVVSRTT